MTRTLKMEVDVPENLLGELMITAFDGGLGGCWHWAEPHRDGPDSDWLEVEMFTPRKAWLEARIRDKEQDEDDPTYWVVHWGTLISGMQKIIDGDFSGHEALRKLQGRIREAVIEDDGTGLDANDVDTIVQYGLFDNERYC